ncbi:MAG: hypothetical protein AAGA85_17715 [Bacteroidota bacterium]
MNYSDHFKDKEDRELVDLLENRKVLNFEAQKCLVSELERRQLQVDEAAVSELRSLIAHEEQNIKDFQYLPFLGFTLRRDPELRIRRLGSARTVDILSVLVAVLMMLVTIPLTWIIQSFINEGLQGVSQVMGFITCVGVLVFGLLLFLRSIERIFNYWRFSIVKEGDQVQIIKGGESYTIQGDRSSSLRILSSDGISRLVLAQESSNEPVTVMSTDGGLRLHLTLKHLRDYLVE